MDPKSVGAAALVLGLIGGQAAMAEDLGGLRLSASRGSHGGWSEAFGGSGFSASSVSGGGPRGLTRVAERAMGTSAFAAGVGDNTFVKARAGAFFARATANRSVGDGSAGGTNGIDLDDTLGADPDSIQAIGAVEVAIPVLDLKIDVGYLGSHELEAQTTNSLSFNGQTFTGTVNTQDTFELIEANIAYELLELSPSDQLGFKVFVGGGMRFVNWRSEINGTVMGMPSSSSEEVFVPLPVVGAGARLDFLEHFYVAADLYVAEYGEFGRVTDIEAVLGYDFFRNAGVYVGYRQIRAETDAFDIEFDTTVEGLILGVELRI